MGITISDIKIKIKLLKSETVLAQATVILFDVWEEHGWKILKSNRIHPVFQEKVWIQAPSYKKFGDWKPLIFINDRKLYEQVQQKIYDAFFMAQNRKEGQDSLEKEKNEKVNPEDIPF